MNNRFLYKYAADTTEQNNTTPPVVVNKEPSWGDWTYRKAGDLANFVIDNPGKSMLIGGSVAGGLWLADSYARARAARRKAERELNRPVPKDVLVVEPKPKPVPTKMQPKTKKASYMYRYNPYNDFYYYSNLYKSASVGNQHNLYNYYYNLYKQAGLGSAITKGVAWGAKALRQAPAAARAWGAQAGNNLQRAYNIGAANGGGMWGGMKAVGGRMWNSTARGFQNMGKGIQNQWTNAGQYIKDNGGIGGVAKNMWNNTAQGFQNMGKGIKDSWDGVVNTYNRGAEIAAKNGKNGIMGGINRVFRQGVHNAGKGMQDFGNNFSKQVGNAWKTGGENAAIYNDAAKALTEKGRDLGFANQYANYVMGGVKAGAYLPHRKYTVYSFLNK